MGDIILSGNGPTGGGGGGTVTQGPGGSSPWLVAIDQTGDNNDVDVINGPGAAAVNIQDGGNSITVDGAVTVSGTVTATVTNDGTFAKETGGNLDAIKADLDEIATDTDKLDVSLSSLNTNVVDSNNSSTAPLAGGGVFTGTATDTLKYRSVVVTMIADDTNNNPIGTLALQWSSDSTNWDYVENYRLPSSIGISVPSAVHARYFRVVYTNDAASTNSFLRLQTLLVPYATAERYPNVSITKTLQLANEDVRLSIPSGYRGVGCRIAFSAYTGTLVPEVSFDGGVTWSATNFWQQQLGGNNRSSFAVTGSVATVLAGIVLPAGTTDVRVRVSTATGTHNAVTTLVATYHPTDYAPSQVAVGSLTIGSSPLLVGGNVTATGFAQQIQLATTLPGASDAGVTVRDAAQGQATMAASRPVVIASDQSAVPISGSVTVSGVVSTKTALTANTRTNSVIGSTSALAVPANASRKGLVLINTSSDIIAFGIDAATAILGTGIVLKPYGVWEMDEYTFTTAAINAISSGSASNLAIQEFST